jgi:hypothetical protein
MKNKLYLLFIIIIHLAVKAQSPKTFSTQIGTSAISTMSLTAKTYSFDNLIYNHKTDTLSNLLFITTRKRDPGTKLYANVGMFGAIKLKSDSVKWYNNTTSFDLSLSNNALLLSNDKKTISHSKSLGIDQIEFPSKLLFCIQKTNSALAYNPLVPDELLNLSLQTGKILWKANVPQNQNWTDVKYLNDSTLIIAAGGLHAININKGLLWSRPYSTTEKIPKSLVYSNLDLEAVNKHYTYIETTNNESQISSLSSNILIADSLIYFASKDKLTSVNYNGKLNWEYTLANKPTSQSMLSKVKGNVVLLNLGIAKYDKNTVIYGKPYLINLSLQTGDEKLDEKNVLESLCDFYNYRGDLVFANKKSISQTNISNTTLESIIEVSEQKFGKFNEFVDGDQYFVEKEGFYVPLNFINDNVVYFKTENDKVYGVAKNVVEYEYHFTELFKLNCKVGDKKVISSRNKSLVISKNFELLATLNTELPCIVNNNKLYIINQRQLHIFNVDDIK